MDHFLIGRLPFRQRIIAYRSMCYPPYGGMSCELPAGWEYGASTLKAAHWRGSTFQVVSNVCPSGRSTWGGPLKGIKQHLKRGVFKVSCIGYLLLSAAPVLSGPPCRVFDIQSLFPKSHEEDPCNAMLGLGDKKEISLVGELRRPGGSSGVLLRDQ